MPTGQPKIYCVATLFASILLILALWLTSATTATAKEPDYKKYRKREPLDKTASVEAITPFDGNRIYNYIANNGDLVTDNVGGKSGFYWPSTPRTSRDQSEADLRGEHTADYSSGLWIAGLVNGEARSAIVVYSSEYIAGKILPNGERDEATLPKYRVYKIMKGDGPGVKDWDEWPQEDGAPVNADGTPKLIGDQTLWFVMNDLDSARHQGPINGSDPIGLEVQTTVFGFNRTDPLGDVMFVKWLIINKGAADLDSAFVGLWDDPDLGYSGDDLIGCDIALGLGFCYNGDTYDEKFGKHPPALGFDFLQGPEAPKGSGHFLKMTAFSKFTCGGLGCEFPENVPEVLNTLSGRWANGNPFIDPTTSQVTKFINSGDPVTRQGWLDLWPGDRYFLMSSGPFTLAVGDTREVVGAKIIAPGSNPINAVTALRFYDAFAQTAYDRKFEAIDAPAPRVEVRRLNQEIVLTWLEGHEAGESFTRSGYQFQGYCVYQGASPNGPFTPIAVFDVIDGIQDIIDHQLDETSGRVLDKLVIAANDYGLQRYISIKTDTIFNAGQPLSNYRDYYFAVTSYVVDLDALPKVIESPLVPIRVAPSAPDYGVSIEAKTGARFDMARNKGKGDGEFFYQIVDPTLMQTATYRVTWNDDSTPELGAYTWNLDRNGVRLLSQQPRGELDVENNPNKDAPIVDGLQIQMFPFMFETPVRILSHRQNVNVSINDNGLSLWGGGSPAGLPDDRSSTFWGGGSNDVERLQADLEFRFTGARISERANDTTIVSGGQLGIIRSRSNADARAVVRLPFELWDVENDVQINVFVTSRNADRRSPWGDNGVPQYYRIAGRDYITPIHTPYNAATVTATAFDRTDSNATWILHFHSGEVQPVSEWSTGDRYLVRFTNPTSPAVDEYSFTTTAAVVSGQTALAKSQLQRINIVPNPYWAHNPMERAPLNRLVRITNLPGQGAKIRIFNLAGDLVRVIDDADRRTDGTSGLQHVNWDLRNHAGYPVGCGVY
ncbi:MAG: hypothetical protein ACREOI_09120, partial [bacterium]